MYYCEMFVLKKVNKYLKMDQFYEFIDSTSIAKNTKYGTIRLQDIYIP